MALQSITNVNIDFIKPEYLMINAKQCDDCSRLIYITCYNDGNIFNFNASKHTAYIKFRKADGLFVFNFCDIDYKGRVLVELTEQMLAAAGVCSAEIKVINKGSAIVDADTGRITAIDNASVLSTMTFYVNVYETTVDDSLIESSDDYLRLNETLELLTADLTDAVLSAKSWAVGTNNDVRENDEYDNSKYYSEQSSESASNALNSANLSESYAVGGTGTRDGEDTDNAKYYCEQAGESADSADESEANALNYATTSQRYAVGGTGTVDGEDEDNAKYYCEQALDSANNADESEANANTYSVVSQRYAVGGTGTVDGEDEDNSKYYCEQANISASSASTSKSNASTSESNALTYMNNAKSYATQSQRYAIGGTGTVDGEDEDNSKYYCDKALESASNIEANADVISNAATLAADSASAAADSADSASTSASAASTSADSASASASAANVSATSASTSETNAANSASEAHTYYLQVEEITTGLSGAFMPMGTIEFSELATLLANGEVEAGYLYNISDDFTTDETFKRGAGVEYPAGTNVYRTSDGYWDCLIGTTVTGVKGNNETEYRKGNVNITVENIGAVSSADVATVDEIKSYLGI